MLKKIVKFGNSSALVLDKAILELLDMKEGSIVKLKTDGTSLIITPQRQDESAPQEKPSQTLEEYLTSKYRIPSPSLSSSPSNEELYKEYNSMLERRNFINALNEKYPGITEKIRDLMINEEYQKELKLLTKEDEETGDHDTYMKKGIELMSKFIPEYQEYSNELMKLYQPNELGVASLLTQEKSKEQKA